MAPESKERRIFRLGAYGIAVVNNKIILTTMTTGPYKGLLALPGGGIEFGETPEATLRREFLEEVAMTFTTLSLVDNLSINLPYLRNGQQCLFHHIGLVYRVTAPKAETDYTAEDPWDWYDLDSLDASLITPFAKEAVRRVTKGSC